ncbi:thyroid hormone receptor beta-like isoform X1 [Tachypleus tridentatus]|uniref:thyroid hormone receptor beta-like isoform X1 n=2 Tax=Tachypleus tridentatus TaxID=6853 RepID=UPI003FD29BDB
MFDGRPGSVFDPGRWIWSIHGCAGMSLPPNGSRSTGLPAEKASSSLSRHQKVCGVCGDRSKSYHFGGISCDSCKAFFRRSVQNEGYKHFHCPYEGKCDITISSRKCCQYCRFQKCLAIGMEKGWVMTEEERLHLLRSRMEKRQRKGATESDRPRRKTNVYDHDPDINEMGKFLTENDVQVIESLITIYEVSYQAVGFSEKLSTQRSERSRTEIIDMFFTVIKQFAHFAQNLEGFSVIPHSDQQVLLRSGVMEMCFLRGAYVFDEKNGCWPDLRKTLYRDSPQLRAEDIKKLVSPTLFEKHIKFVTAIKELDPDEPTIMLLLVTVLLSPDRPNLENVDLVAKQQEKYYILLKKYMLWRYGSSHTSVLYPKLFLKLPDLRELNDAHTDYHLKLDKDEMEEVQQRLSNLKLDSSSESSSAPEPYGVAVRHWSIRRDLLLDLRSSSPLDLEEESSSSEGSDRFAMSKLKHGVDRAVEELQP